MHPGWIDSLFFVLWVQPVDAQNVRWERESRTPLTCYARGTRDDFRPVSPLFILIEAYAAADVFLFLYLCGRAERFMRMNPSLCFLFSLCRLIQIKCIMRRREKRSATHTKTGLTMRMRRENETSSTFIRRYSPNGEEVKDCASRTFPHPPDHRKERIRKLIRWMLGKWVLDKSFLFSFKFGRITGIYDSAKLKKKAISWTNLWNKKL